ncbi:sensor histidine kinase [Microvirga terricola]|uniref:Blue-light-activated histidine kinase n=1 Tax=Microvirga terricola TaxID=2719797 RepID=A0ABX0V8W8_9HYPH|nr:HWE histidine kinase domain-containing protein [Microvirga terricola]NIX76292.1 PAS domain-containing protein [Microvirga terricola]
MLNRYTNLAPANSPAAYAITAVMVALAITVRMALQPLLGDNLLYITLYPVVLTVTVFGGGRAGMLALVLGLFVAAAFPAETGKPLLSAGTLVGLGLYLAGAGLSVWVADALRRTVERLEVEREKLVTTLGATGAGTWRWDFREDCIEWDPALASLFRLDPADVPRRGAEFIRFVYPEDLAYVEGAVRKAAETGSGEYEFRAVLPDGDIRWMYCRCRMIRDPKRLPYPLMVGACLDVTERKQGLERQNLLVHELNHRVKNTLSVVQSLALQTLRGSTSLESFKEAFQARLLALSATHNILTEALWESACMREILSAELEPFGGIDERRVSAVGDEIRLTPHQALTFGMAFHELATNAAKYGALSAPQGSIDIAWRTEQDSSGRSLLKVDWVERNGPPVHEPTRKGFGSKLIERGIRHELEGSLDMRFLTEGLRCSFAVPL